MSIVRYAGKKLTRRYAAIFMKQVSAMSTAECVKTLISSIVYIEEYRKK